MQVATEMAGSSRGARILATEARAEARMGEENMSLGPPDAVFEAATLPYLGSLFRLAVRLTGSASAAEDLVQETYLRALQSFATLRDHSRVRPWLFRILSRLVIDRHRAYGREVPLEDSEDPDSEDLGPEDLDRFSLYDRIADEDPLPYSDKLHTDFLTQFRDEDVRRALLAPSGKLSGSSRPAPRRGDELPRHRGGDRLPDRHGHVPVVPRPQDPRARAVGMRPKTWTHQDLDAMSKPMTCDQAVRLFFSYLDRALAGETQEDLKSHMEACLDCCDRLQFSREVDAFVRDRIGDEAAARRPRGTVAGANPGRIRQERRILVHGLFQRRRGTHDHPRHLRRRALRRHGRGPQTLHGRGSGGDAGGGGRPGPGRGSSRPARRPARRARSSWTWAAARASTPSWPRGRSGRRDA